jgi:hypothetical protein
LIVALTVASIDICSAIFLKETVTIAAYEGARVGAEKGGTNALVTARVRQILDQRNVTYSAGSVSSVSSPSFDAADTMQHVTVTVTVPCAGNLLAPSQFFAGRNLQASVTIRKQFKNAN